MWLKEQQELKWLEVVFRKSSVIGGREQAKVQGGKNEHTVHRRPLQGLQLLFGDGKLLENVEQKNDMILLIF